MVSHGVITVSHGVIMVSHGVIIALYGVIMLVPLVSIGVSYGIMWYHVTNQVPPRALCWKPLVVRPCSHVTFPWLHVLVC